MQDWPLFLGLKLTHITEYGILAVLLAWGLARGSRLSWRALCGISVAVTVLWGASDEAHQYFVPSRTARFLDVISDAVGAVTFTAGYARFRFFSVRQAAVHDTDEM